MDFETVQIWEYRSKEQERGGVSGKNYISFLCNKGKHLLTKPHHQEKTTMKLHETCRGTFAIHTHTHDITAYTQNQTVQTGRIVGTYWPLKREGHLRPFIRSRCGIILHFRPWSTHARTHTLHGKSHTKTNKYVYTKRPVCIFESCVNALAQELHTHTHLLKSMPQQRDFTRKPVPLPQRECEGGGKCRECKKDVG